MGTSGYPGVQRIASGSTSAIGASAPATKQITTLFDGGSDAHGTLLLCLTSTRLGSGGGEPTGLGSWSVLSVNGNATLWMARLPQGVSGKITIITGTSGHPYFACAAMAWSFENASDADPDVTWGPYDGAIEVSNEDFVLHAVATHGQGGVTYAGATPGGVEESTSASASFVPLLMIGKVGWANITMDSRTRPAWLEGGAVLGVANAVECNVGLWTSAGGDPLWDTSMAVLIESRRWTVTLVQEPCPVDDLVGELTIEHRREKLTIGTVVDPDAPVVTSALTTVYSNVMQDAIIAVVPDAGPPTIAYVNKNGLYYSSALVTYTVTADTTFTFVWECDDPPPPPPPPPPPIAPVLLVDPWMVWIID